MTFWDSLQGLTPVDVFMSASIIPKMVMTLVVVSGALTLILAIIRHATKAPRSTILIGMGAGVVFLSSLGALYEGYNTYAAAKVTSLANVAPSVAEASLCYSLGLMVMLIAVAGNWGAPKARSK